MFNENQNVKSNERQNTFKVGSKQRDDTIPYDYEGPPFKQKFYGSGNSHTNANCKFNLHPSHIGPINQQLQSIIQNEKQFYIDEMQQDSKKSEFESKKNQTSEDGHDSERESEIYNEYNLKEKKVPCNSNEKNILKKYEINKDFPIIRIENSNSYSCSETKLNKIKNTKLVTSKLMNNNQLHSKIKSANKEYSQKKFIHSFKLPDNSNQVISGMNNINSLPENKIRNGMMQCNHTDLKDKYSKLKSFEKSFQEISPPNDSFLKFNFEKLSSIAKVTTGSKNVFIQSSRKIYSNLKKKFLEISKNKEKFFTPNTNKILLKFRKNSCSPFKPRMKQKVLRKERNSLCSFEEAKLSSRVPMINNRSITQKNDLILDIQQNLEAANNYYLDRKKKDQFFTNIRKIDELNHMTRTPEVL